MQFAQATDRRLDTLESTTGTRFGALESNTVRLESYMAALAAAEAHSEERLSALIDIVRQDRNGTAWL